MKHGVAGTLAALALLAVSGCAGASSEAGESVASPTLSPTPTASPTPVPSWIYWTQSPVPTIGASSESESPEESPPSPESVVMSDTWTQGDGWRYSIRTDLSSGLDVDVDTTRSSPGKATIEVSLNATAVIGNLTDDRIAPSPSLVTVLALWPTKSKICKVRKADSLVSDASGKKSYCGYTWDLVIEDSVTTSKASPYEEIPEGDSLTVRSERGSRTFVVPEDDAYAYEQLATYPPIWALGRIDGQVYPQCRAFVAYGGVDTYVAKSTQPLGCEDATRSEVY